MNKSDLLRLVAERGYDVGFGAKKHFATYDIIEKVPGWIGFSSIAFGIFSLAYSGLATEFISATFVVLGVVSLYVGFYAHQKQLYEDAGKTLTELFYQLKKLYLTVKSSESSDDLAKCEKEFRQIEDQFLSACISKQILFSNWYAHYKFYWELQVGWVDEQLHFRFFRDKVPLSLWFFVLIMVISIGVWSFEPFSHTVCTGS